MRNPLRYFNSSLKVLRRLVVMNICYPLSMRQVEDILFERVSSSARDGSIQVQPVQPDVYRRDQ